MNPVVDHKRPPIYLEPIELTAYENVCVLNKNYEY